MKMLTESGIPGFCSGRGGNRTVWAIRSYKATMIQEDSFFRRDPEFAWFRVLWSIQAFWQSKHHFRARIRQTIRIYA